MNTSRKAVEWLICFSIVNLFLGCLLFKKFNESCSFSKAARMSSAYLKGKLSGLRQFLTTENPLKMMKNAFISPQKLFSSSRYLSFCLDFLVMYQNVLIKKIRLILNFMASQPG